MILCPCLILLSAAPTGVAGKGSGFPSPFFPYIYILSQNKAYKQVGARIL